MEKDEEEGYGGAETRDRRNQRLAKGEQVLQDIKVWGVLQIGHFGIVDPWKI